MEPSGKDGVPDDSFERAIGGSVATPGRPGSMWLEKGFLLVACDEGSGGGNQIRLTAAQC